ncbi:hypothetical protein RZS28_03870 [Methylocapsa polymorpha]|uniref:GIY-YIG domain-containing protein n=1 Tax=Methylocapsa polymorpha TaxID=3080828 RepID=A0ABZ0HV64_9HYPH|nr:hypothetical protein RZS28_03870 [Methylocapsa sp. RX1]
MSHGAEPPRMGGGTEPTRAGGRSPFEPRATVEPGGGGKPPSGEHGLEPAPAKPLEPAEVAPAKKPVTPASDAAPAKSKPSAKAEEAAPSAKPEEAAPSAKPEEAAPSAKPKEAGPPAKPEPFDMKQIGADAEAPQILAPEDFSSVKLKPGQDALYILRDAEGTILKVGKTSANGAVNRFSVYKRAGTLTGKNVQLEVHPLKAGGRNAEFYEQALREQMEGQGHALPWDNTSQRLGRPGFGTPGEGVRKSHVTKGEMAELLTEYKGNLQEVGRELGLHRRTVDLWAKALGLLPKNFK